MNSKQEIVKQILDSGIYKQTIRKRKVSIGIWINSRIIALRFLPAIICEVRKHGRR
jgi:hypothetical protein